MLTNDQLQTLQNSSSHISNRMPGKKIYYTSCCGCLTKFINYCHNLCNTKSE